MQAWWPHARAKSEAAASLGDGATHGGAAPGLRAYGKDILDLIGLAELTADELVDTLRPLQFQDYSDRLRPLAHPGIGST